MRLKRSFERAISHYDVIVVVVMPVKNKINEKNEKMVLVYRNAPFKMM